VKKGSQDKKR